MSSAFRDSGCVIMKMISSTSNTSIIGVTLMSEFTPPELPAVIAISLLLLLGALLLGFLEQARHGWLRDRRHDADSCLPRGLDRVLNPGVFQIVVGLEVQNLVLVPVSVDGAKLVCQRRILNRPPVEEVLAVLV